MAPTDHACSYEFDLYVSYANPDDYPVEWVNELLDAIRMQFRLRGEREPRIRFEKQPMFLTKARSDPSPHGDSLPNREKEFLGNSALLLTILSPAFMASQRCVEELSSFTAIASTSRVVKVVKMPGDDKYPLADVPEHRFFRYTTERAPQELSGNQYQRAVDGLVAQIELLLSTLSKSDPVAKSQESRMEVFLCHAHEDTEAALKLWQKLHTDGFAPWLDKKALLPGQEWEVEVEKAIERVGAIIVCLSKVANEKESYLQREMRLALKRASEMPSNTIFLIPARLDACPVSRDFATRQWVDLFEESGYDLLLQALRMRAAVLDKRRALASVANN